MVRYAASQLLQLIVSWLLSTCCHTLTRSESKWKAVDRCPALYCSAGRQSTTKKRTPSYNEKYNQPTLSSLSSYPVHHFIIMEIGLKSRRVLTCCIWLACKISGTDTGRHSAWLKSMSSSFRATRLLPKRYWFIYRDRKSKERHSNVSCQ